MSDVNTPHRRWRRIAVLAALTVWLLLMGERHGWGFAFGVALIVVGGAAFLLINTPGLVFWVRSRPRILGMLLGPVLLLVSVTVTPWPLWIGVAAGLAGTTIGAMLVDLRRPRDDQRDS